MVCVKAVCSEKRPPFPAYVESTTMHYSLFFLVVFMVLSFRLQPLLYCYRLNLIPMNRGVGERSWNCAQGFARGSPAVAESRPVVRGLSQEQPSPVDRRAGRPGRGEPNYRERRKQLFIFFSCEITFLFFPWHEVNFRQRPPYVRSVYLPGWSLCRMLQRRWADFHVKTAFFFHVLF